MLKTSDISKIILPEGNQYDLKDTVARQTAEELIIVSRNQPDAENNVLWINSEEGSSVVVPTQEDLETALSGKLNTSLGVDKAGRILTVDADGDVTAESVSTLGIPTTSAVEEMLEAKVDIAQDAANAGKVMAVNASGNLEPTELDHVTHAELSSAVSPKLDQSQGTSNAGKYMLVNAEGNITPVELHLASSDDLTQGLGGKVDVAQGVNKAGQFLVVNQSGNVEAASQDIVSSSDLSTALSAKVDIEQDTADAGKVLAIGNDGNVVPTQLDTVGHTELTAELAKKLDIAQGQNNANRYLVTDASGNIAAQSLSLVSTEHLATELSAKLDKSAGAGNSGAFMVVNNSGNIVPEQKTFVTPNALANDLAGKVDVAQGASNANKYLVTDQNGNVVAETKNLSSQEYVDSIITISSQQPTDESNKLWIKTDADGSVTVPTTAELESALANKVDKVDGKILTSNDFTDGLKALLESVEEDAQENVIETIQVNGTARPVSSKTVNITVPTNVSDLTNDSGFATLASPQFTGTPTAPTAAAGNASTQIASTAFVANAVNTALSSVYVLKGTKATVADLPTTGNEIGHVWHVNADGSEYFWNGTAWEFMGKMVDLTNYVQDAAYVHTDSNFTAGEKSKLGNIAPYAQVNTIEGIKVNGTLQTPDIDKVVSITVPTQGSDIGLGNVENKSSADIRGELTKANVTTALGYEPPQYNTTYDALSEADAKAGTDTIAGLISPAVLDAAITNKGYTTNAGTVTKIKMNGSDIAPGLDGTVNIGTVITQHQDLSGKLDANLTPANSGKYLKVDASGDVQAVDLDAVSTGALNSALAGKVDVAQPSANTGDLLAVDSNGRVTPQTIDYATKSYADGVINVGTSEPTDSHTKLWINTSDVAGTTVPTEAEVSAALNQKVDKETGKGLSSENFTSGFKTKLEGIAESAQVNVIETIQLNGTTLSPTNKTVNIVTPVPETMTSDEAKAGTNTTAKLVSAKAIDDAITNKGYTQNVGTVTGVKMNNGTAAAPDSNGVVDLGTVITAHQDISGKQNKNLGAANAKKLLTVNSSGDIDVSSITTDNISTISSAVDGKVAISQGTNNAGKIMVVGSDGNLAATSISRAIIECENGTWSIARSTTGAPTITVDVGQTTSGNVSVPTTTQMQTGLAAKLNNNFGASESGKFLVVGSDGQITAVTMQQWQAGSY